MTDKHFDDNELATAAEQSSEEDEAQEGNILAEAEASEEAAEHAAIHVEDDRDDDSDLAELLEALDAATDPEADAIVDDALDIDSMDEADASVAATEDEAAMLRDELEAALATSTGRAVTEPAEPEHEPTAEAEVEVEADPYDAFKLELRLKPGKWYVVHSYAGFEKSVKQNIENRRQSMAMEDSIYEVQVPTERVVEIKNGQRKLVERVRIPSYVMVRMELNEDSWSTVRHTPGVTGFVGNAHNPVPLRFDEAFGMLKSLVEVTEVPAAKGRGGKGQQASRAIPAEVDFEVGETITIKEGSFEGLPGTISEISPESGKLTVLVSLFERETPVTLGFEQVTKL